MGDFNDGQIVICFIVMHVDLLTYIIILGIASLLIFVLSRFSPVREWSRAAYDNKFWLLVTCVVWSLLLWPEGVDEVYEATMELGALRLARVLFFLLLSVILSFYFINKLRSRVVSCAALSAYLAYTVVCLASTLYSPDQLQTVWKSFELLVSVLFGYALLQQTRGRPDKAADLVYGSAFFLLVFSVCSLVGGVLFPDIAYGISESAGELDTGTRSMGGIIPRINANTLGQIAGTITCLGLIELVGKSEKKKLGALIIIAVGCVTLLFAHSRTSFLAFLLLFPVVLLAMKRFSVMLFLFSLGIASVPFGLSLFWEHLARGQTVDQFYSMSGRIYVWERAFEAFLANPWLGLGFYAGHKSLDLSGILSAHSTIDNTHLESLVNVGILGTVFLTLFALIIVRDLGVVLRRLGKSENEDLKAILFILTMTGFILVRSLTGPTYQVLHINLYIMLFCAVCLAVFRRNPGRGY